MQEIASRPSLLRRIARTREVGTLASLLALCLVIVLSSSQTRAHFLDPVNLRNLSRQIALVSILAIGQTFVIIAAGIDLSVGSMLGFIGVLTAAMMMHAGWAWPLAVVASLVFSVGVGVFHAFLVGWVRLQPFVATLGTMSILRGAAQLMTGAVPIAITVHSYNYLGNGDWLGLPMPVWFMIAVAIIAIFLLDGTAYGKYIYAIGSNEEATRLSGVNVRTVKIIAYSVCSLFAGLAGVLYAAYTRQGDPSFGMGYELSAIAAAVIGGCNLMGGEGSVVGTILGASILSVILNGLNLMIRTNSSLWEGVMVGSVVLVAVTLNTLRTFRTRGSQSG